MKKQLTIGLEVNADMGFSTKDEGNLIEILPDSAEQIAVRMERLGSLRDQLYAAFQEAIARANKGRQESEQPAIDGTRKGNSDDKAPVKYDKP